MPLDLKPRLPRMPGQRPKATLVAAAAVPAAEGAEAAEGAAPEPSTSDTRLDIGSRAAGGDVMDVDTAAPAPAPTAAAESKPTITRAAAAGPSSAPMAISRSTTAGSDRSGTAPPPAGGEVVTKMKFKPKMPIRRAATQMDVEVKAEPSSSASTAAIRGRPSARARGRGRGGAAGPPGRSNTQQSFNQTVAAGPFGGSRATSSRRVVAPPPPPRTGYGADPSSIEVYSDNEDGGNAGGVIDIEAVSGLSESAPTSIYRDRDLDGGKAKAKEMEKAKLKDMKRRKKAERAARAAARAAALAAAGNAGQSFAELNNVNVKAEPISPFRPTAILPDPNAGVPAPLGRVGDSMIPADEQDDRDEAGRRVRALTTGTVGTTGDTTPETEEEVNAAHAVNLSESESEEEEEDMEGDFVFVDGLDNPEDKLFTFQFPSQFPKFVSRAPVDATADGGPEEVKPTPATLRGRRKSGAVAPPPEGRIGTLCVMKSGKVKLVMGEGDDGIVMNVTPGVPTTFLQQLVHMDAKAKSTTVLGEIHKGYVVTPDVDRLLEELFINGGETPGDRERAQAAIDRRVKMERGLVKMEPSSP